MSAGARSPGGVGSRGIARYHVAVSHLIDESRCEECLGMAGSYLDPMQDPEYCECCEQVLCERCWFVSHVTVLY